MIKIGILPTTKLYEDNNPYNDKYIFYNVYIRRIYEAGAIPIGILLNDGKLDYNILDLCDGFIICGGNKIEPYYLEVINYAINKNKPLLGICLGMQSIGVYSYLEKLLQDKKIPKTIDNISSMFKKIKEDKVNFLKPVEGHYNIKITREEYLPNKHEVSVVKDSILYNIYKQNNLNVLSMHHYAINEMGNNVLINCVHYGIIEGIEYKNKNLFILGVQFHPEIEDANHILFEALVKECEKRISQ